MNHHKVSQKIYQSIIVVGLLSIFTVKSDAQVSLMVGGDYATIRHEVDMQNIKPILTYHLGMAVHYYPFKNAEKLSLVNELLFRQKGYQQELDKTYTMHFNYLALPVLLDYQLGERVSIQGGFELDGMISTNIKRSLETYNHFDAGLVLGLNFISREGISFYSRITYGIFPMLDYYGIDELGNFGPKIHDLKNECISIGIKYAFNNEKIRLFK